MWLFFPGSQQPKVTPGGRFPRSHTVAVLLHLVPDLVAHHGGVLLQLVQLQALLLHPLLVAAELLLQFCKNTEGVEQAVGKASGGRNRGEPGEPYASLLNIGHRKWIEHDAGQPNVTGDVFWRVYYGYDVVKVFPCLRFFYTRNNKGSYMVL